MAAVDGHFSKAISPEHTYGNVIETLAIKQEALDLENANAEWADEMEHLESDVGESDVNYVKFPIKKEHDSMSDEAERSKGTAIPDQISKSEISFTEHFDFIRTCLGMVLHVDPEGRHELVQAISSKLKYIEAVTTGKNIKKTIAEKQNFDIPNILEQYSNPKSHQAVRSSQREPMINKKSDDEQANTSDEEESTLDAQKDDDSEFEEDLVMKVKNSSEAVVLNTTALTTPIGSGAVKCNICHRIVTNPRKSCAACSSFVSRVRSKNRNEKLPLPTCSHRNFSGGESCRSCRLRKYVLLSKRIKRTPVRRRWTVQPLEGNASPKSNMSDGVETDSQQEANGDANEVDETSKIERAKPIQSRRWDTAPHSQPKFSQTRRQSTKKRRSRQYRKQKCLICEKMTPWMKGWRCSACFIFYSRLVARYQNGEELPEACGHDGFYAGVGCKGCRILRLQKEAEHREPELAARLPPLPSRSGVNSNNG